MRKARFERIAPFFCVWGFGIGLGAYPLLRELLLAVSLLHRVPFSNAKKEPKGFAPGVRHFAEAQCSLATVSIRGHRLRFASLHLLSMNAAAPHGATRLPPDEHLRSACRWGKKPDQQPDQEPLTLALSRRERELIEVFGRGAPTCDTALNSGFEKHTNRLPLPRERELIEVYGRSTPT
ncbi:hypothetical protein A1354_14765 [Pseudomonas asplenii]|nr:hypothetical protein A1354_14765 [Pseudomonas asplenii]